MDTSLPPYNAVNVDDGGTPVGWGMSDGVWAASAFRLDRPWYPLLQRRYGHRPYQPLALATLIDEARAYACHGNKLAGVASAVCGYSDTDIGFTVGECAIRDVGTVADVEVSRRRLTHGIPDRNQTST